MAFTNVVEISLASLIHPDLEKIRKNYILEMENNAKRAGALAIHGFVKRFPGVATSIFAHNIRNRGYSFVGAGADYTALRKGDLVTKVHRRSMGMQESERVDLAAQQSAEHKVIAPLMGNFIVGQGVYVEDHPYIRRKRAVQISQPFIPHEPTQVFVCGSDRINELELEKNCSKYPNTEHQWLNLASLTLQSYEDTEMVPDLTGVGNIGIVDSGDLVLIDGQPIVASRDNEVAMRILNQATHLLEVLAA